MTRRETELLENILKLNKNDRILDLCGGHGRHSLELVKRGYSDLTVLDFSDYLIRLGKKMAKEARCKVKFVRRDARFSGLKSDDYSAIFIMANSFGYFPDEKENSRILKEVHRLLKKGGRLLLDIVDPSHVKNNLKSISWHEANSDVLVCRQRQLEGDIVKAREIVLSKKRGLLRDGFYCERIYNKDTIARLLKTAGFSAVSVKKGVSLHRQKRDYGFLTSRMFVTAVKK